MASRYLNSMHSGCVVLFASNVIASGILGSGTTQERSVHSECVMLNIAARGLEERQRQA